MIDLSLSKQLLSLVHMSDQPIQVPANNVGAAQAVFTPSQNPQQAQVAQALPAMLPEPQPAVENVHLAEDVNLEVCSHFI